MAHQLRRLHIWAVITLLFTSSPLFAADAKRWQPIREPGDFVVALASDPRGYVWIGTEDKGVWRYDPKAEPPKHIKQFTTADGLGDDNAYAIAVDKLGRVWVGHLNHGVSVFDGEKWKNYDVLDGPLGERIFAITTCPTDGDVWIATSAGLTRYSLKDEAWTYFTRADGLPEDQANALAFDAKGNLYVGTQCHGVARALAGDGYKKWTVTPGPAVTPTTPKGIGLPSGLINGLTVAADGTVYAATTAGLGWTKDQGKSWSFLRGRDYADKVKNRIGGAPAGWTEAPKDSLDELLSEDYVTCVAQDDAGLLWLGFRQKGCVAFDPKTNKRSFESNNADGLPDDFVTAVALTPTSKPLVATYGGSVAELIQALKTGGGRKETGKIVEGPPKLPTAAGPPTATSLKSLAEELDKIPARKNEPVVQELNDDWRTQGTWIDRYGFYSATLCAMAGGGNDLTGGEYDCWFDHRHWLGRKCSRGDRLRHWIHFRSTDNPRCLQNPLLGGRRQSEHDDHGETYAMSADGPHVYATLKIPKGEYVLACYIMNKDGHDGSNRWRDFLVEVRPTPMTAGKFDALGLAGHEAEALFESAASQARGRVATFWGGVYKRFYVRAAESTYVTVRVKRNYSFNTILSAVFLDPIGERCGAEGPVMSPAVPHGSRLLRGEGARTDGLEGEWAKCFDRLLTARDANPFWYAVNGRRELLTLVRSLRVRDADGGTLAARVESARCFDDLRPAVAEAFADLQMFEESEKVFWSPRRSATFRWEGVSRAGARWEWNRDEFGKWVEKRNAAKPW